MMTRKTAEQIDFILSKEKYGICDLYCDSIGEARIIGYELEKLNFGKYVSAGILLINEEAIIAYRHGYRAMQYFIDKDREEQRANQQALLTNEQLKAAKREPYMRVWAIISTIISLILAYLQYSK